MFKQLKKTKAILPYTGLILGLVLYISVESYFFTCAVSEVDTAGYVFMAEKIARGELPVVADKPFQCQNHVWVKNCHGDLMPKYVPGYPLLMAIGYLFFGNTGIFLVSPVCGVFTLIGAFLLFRLWVKPFWANIGVLLLSMNAMFLVYTGYPLTHAANICFVTWGMFFLWKWLRTPQYRWGSSVGLCLGLAVLIRPTDVLLLAAVGIVIVRHLLLEKRTHRLYISMCVLLGCLAFFPALNMVYNYYFFGNPLLTGYALSCEQGAFSFSRFIKNIVFVLVKFNNDGIGFFFIMGSLGMFVFGKATDRIVVFCWGFPLILLYSAYYFCSPALGWAFTRFLICTFPVFIGMSMVICQKLFTQRMVSMSAGSLLLLITVAFQYSAAKRGLMHTVANHGLKMQERVSGELDAALPENAVVFTYRPLAFRIANSKNFAVYDLNAFNSSYMLRYISNPSVYSPKIQPDRKESLIGFYQRNRHQLKALKSALVDEFIKEERPVYIVVPLPRMSHEKKALAEFTVDIEREWDEERLVRGKIHRQRWGIGRVTRIQ